MQYVPYNRLAGIPNIIVDSTAVDSTRLTLSHWPGSETPSELKADLSAEIVFNFLDSDFSAPDAEVVSNNHFDEDGLVSMFALFQPEVAQEEKKLLIDIATAGDFGTYQDREAARVCFVLQAWTQPSNSPLNRGVFQKSYDEITAILYEELLPRFGNLFQRVHYLEQYWSAEDILLDWSEAAIEAGDISVEEFPEIDFAVVTTPNSKTWNEGRPVVEGARWTHATCHQFAVHNKTDASRILISNGETHDFYYRYEGWVETVVRKPQARIDLKHLADSLTKLENKNKVHWKAESIGDIVPHLNLQNSSKSSLSTKSVKDSFIEYFASASR